MIELKPCPFNAEHEVSICVFDGEGNYHGLLGCEYESNPWSGLRYAITHKENCFIGDGEYEPIAWLFDSPEEAAEAWNERFDPSCSTCKHREYSEVHCALPKCMNYENWEQR